MDFLRALFIVVEVLCCLMLIGLVLMQKAKNEGLGLAFGASAGESLFGARAGNVLSKATVILGITFLASTLILGVLFAQRDKTLMDTRTSTAAEPVAVQPQPIENLDLGEPQIEVVPDMGSVPAIEVPTVSTNGI